MHCKPNHNITLRDGILYWSCLLRACPPCLELLHSLHETECAWISEPEWYEDREALHNVIQWLKVN
jgi:hypothetical protein